MRKIWKMIMITFAFGIVVVLSACNGGQEEATDTNGANGTDMNNVSHHPTDTNLNDPSIIPSENGEKTETTNEHGSTYDGMGQDIYGSIGSSGIHEGGVSSFFESILEGEGITGVKVFVVDDSVILARKEEQTTSHEYDHMQSDILSGTEGMSGKGEPEGVESTQEESLDNFDQAKTMMSEMFNGDVKVLTVTDPKAPDLIETIKENILNSSYEEASNNLLTLFKMTK
ncbi:hypothetical protein [Virgibacillus necropolis]|uniref:Sporulation protein n=1 Tax=Virgibacillus necropolis TaxID=163877 RepID=A0A221MEF2_9BACI|nr:hypothetical protein [Virgibacillus necropolis]ASN06014.1 hypothetical protein CFK40_13810 [Virgibacillus necropolis]